MLPYKTIRLEEFPDVADIQRDGRASHIGRFAERNGVDFKSYIRNASAKRSTRRYLKRLDRRNQIRIEAIDNN